MFYVYKYTIEFHRIQLSGEVLDDYRDKKPYHYTNLETLALTLQNMTLRFTSLALLDDPQENMTADIPNFGRFCYASCWTSTAVESIPMWNMYASLETGVRISLPFAPFMPSLYTKSDEPCNVTPLVLVGRDRTTGGLVCSQDFNAISKLDGFMDFFEMKYTDDRVLLVPQLKTAQDENSVEIQLGKFGHYKNKHWSFQQECRYQINSLFAAELNRNYSYEQLKNRVNCALNGSPIDIQPHLDVALYPGFLQEMEVVLSPKMSEGNKILARSLMHYYPLGTIVDSRLTGLL